MTINMRFINIFIFLFSLFSCESIAKKQDEQLNEDLGQESRVPVIKFEKDIFNFGEIEEGESITVDFKMTNIGSAPLLIRSAKGSCGCTVPDNWPKEEIDVGEEAVITVTFNSKGRTGKQQKNVTLVTNCIPSVKVLTIKGTVIVP